MRGHNVLHQDGSSEGSQHRFLLRNMKNHLLFYVSPHLFWSSASYSQSKNSTFSCCKDRSLCEYDAELQKRWGLTYNGGFVCKFSRNVYSKLYPIEN